MNETTKAKALSAVPPETTQPPVREGDVVKYLPNGETWCVAGVYDNGDILCMGWPCSLARVGEYEIVERCDNAEHEMMIRNCARIQSDSGGFDPRRSLATEKLRLRALSAMPPETGLQLAEKYMREEYGAKRTGEWIVCGVHERVAEFAKGGHNVQLATYNSELGIVRAFRFEAAMKVG